MRFVILLVLVCASAASPLSESETKKSSGIAENLQRFKNLVMEKFEQMRSGRAVTAKENRSEETEEKPSRTRNSKIMRFEESTTTETPAAEDENKTTEGNIIEEAEKLEEEGGDGGGEVMDKEEEEEVDEKKEDKENADQISSKEAEKRKQKNMNYFPYSYQRPLYNYEYDPNLNYFYNPPKDFQSSYIPEEWLGRTEPFKRKNNPNLPDSPIYYIRLPPSPYVFVPGIGYVSRPPSLNDPEVVNSLTASTHDKKPNSKPNDIQPSQFLHVPIDFVSNGKPTSVYQIPNDPIKPIRKPEISQLDKGPYFFNGRPIDIYLLRNSYNALYADALTNFYP